MPNPRATTANGLSAHGVRLELLLFLHTPRGTWYCCASTMQPRRLGSKVGRLDIHRLQVHIVPMEASPGSRPSAAVGRALSSAKIRKSRKEGSARLLAESKTSRPLAAACAQTRPQTSSCFFVLLRAWIARGAVWCPPQARHGLSITHLSAGCQGFEALSKACSCSEQRAKTVWKMFAQIHTRTAPREAQRDCTTPRLIGFDIGLSPAASAPRMDPNTSVCGSPPSAPLSMAHPLLQEQCSTGKILACADALGTGHARPEKNHGEVRAQLRRARGGVRREHEGGGFERHWRTSIYRSSSRSFSLKT